MGVKKIDNLPILSTLNHLVNKLIAIFLVVILYSCGPSVDEYMATYIAETATADNRSLYPNLTITSESTKTPTTIPKGDLLVPEDYPTIQEAIDTANNGDVIVVSPGTYRENIDFIGKNITLRSTEPGNPLVMASTVIDGGGRGSVVTFKSGETSEARLEGFQILNGKSTFGGGIFITENSSPMIVNNIISGNFAEKAGGGICVENSTPTIENNLIFGNKAQAKGGGIYLFGSPETQTFSILSNDIAGNLAGQGGGIALDGSFSPLILDNTITENDALLGGGIGLSNFSSPTIEENILEKNNAFNGGGIYIHSYSSPTILNNIISSNSADLGGGIFVTNFGLPTIEDNLFEHNNAVYSGGGLYLDNPNAMVNSNVFQINTAGKNGGAIWVSGSDSLKDSVKGKGLDDNEYSDNQPDDIFIKPEE
jgi:parallel beta-helix repeat protein